MSYGEKPGGHRTSVTRDGLLERYSPFEGKSGKRFLMGGKREDSYDVLHFDIM